MANETILVVDGDARSRKVLEVSFRKAGYRAEVTDTLAGARAILSETEPDLIVSDTDLPDGDGFAFCADLQKDPQLARVPFLFVTDDSSLPRRAEGLEIGADDYLTRPFFVNDVIERVEILLRERSRDLIKGAEVDEYEGTLSEITMIDLLQTIDVEERTGTITFTREDQQAAMSFRHGEITDAVCGKLQGEEAVYRLMLWPSGEFRVRYQEEIQGADYIDKSIDELLLTGIERLEAWDALIDEVPSLDRVFDADYSRLPQLLETVPQEVARVVRLFDGYRTLQDVIDDSPVGDVESLQIIRRLHEDGFLEDVTPEDERRAVREESHLAEWLEQREKSDERFGRDEPTSPGMPGSDEDEGEAPPEIEEPTESTGSMAESTEPRPSPGPMASETDEEAGGQQDSEPMAGLADALADEMAGESLSDALDEAAGDLGEAEAGGQVTEPERPGAPFDESEDSDVRYDAQRTADEHEQRRRRTEESAQKGTGRERRPEQAEGSRPEGGFERDAETKEYQEDLAAAERRRRREEARQLTRQKHESEEEEQPTEEPARGAPQMPGAREARPGGPEQRGAQEGQQRDRQSTPRAFPTAQDADHDSTPERRTDTGGDTEPADPEERYHRPEGETAPMQPVEVSPEQEEQIRAATERRREQAKKSEETHQPQGEIPDIERVSENGEIIRAEYDLSAPEDEEIDAHEVEARAGASTTREGMAWREEPDESADTTVESRPSPEPEGSEPVAEPSTGAEKASEPAEARSEVTEQPSARAKPEIRQKESAPSEDAPSEDARSEEPAPEPEETEAPESVPKDRDVVGDDIEQTPEADEQAEEAQREPEDEEETAVVDDPAEAFFQQAGEDELEEGWDFDEDYEESGGIQTWHYGAIAAAVLAAGVVLWVATPFGGNSGEGSSSEQKAEAVETAEGAAAAKADESDEDTGLTESQARGRSETLARNSVDEATTLAQVLGGTDPLLAGGADAGMAAPPRPDAGAMAKADAQETEEQTDDEGAGPSQQQVAAQGQEATGQGAQQQGGGSPQPDPTQQRVQRASQLVNGGQYDQALRLLRQLRKEIPGNSRVSTLYLQVASGYQTGGNPDQAREVYQEYLNTWPSGQMAGEVRSIMQRL